MSWLANFLINAAATVTGFTNMTVAAVLAIVAVALWAFNWHWRQLKDGKPGVQSSHVLLVGLAGIWIAMTLAIGAAAWIIWHGQGFASSSLISAPEGDLRPLKWYHNLEMLGGPLSNRNVFTLTFSGANVSQSEIAIKSASIRSAINGAELPLKIVAENPQTKKNEITSIESVNLIPSGSPIKLVAEFNPPNGLSAQDFLATWAKFNLVVSDGTSEYRVPFNEGSIQAFFPGMVGPHVTMKTESVVQQAQPVLSYPLQNPPQQ